MEVNKRQYSKINDKKVLHKVKKQWVTISMALLGALGLGAISQVQTHASGVHATNYNLNHSQSQNTYSLNSSNQNHQTSQNPEQILKRANQLTGSLIDRAALADNGKKISLHNSSKQATSIIRNQTAEVPNWTHLNPKIKFNQINKSDLFSNHQNHQINVQPVDYDHFVAGRSVSPNLNFLAPHYHLVNNSKIQLNGTQHQINVLPDQLVDTVNYVDSHDGNRSLIKQQKITTNYDHYGHQYTANSNQIGNPDYRLANDGSQTFELNGGIHQVNVVKNAAHIIYKFGSTVVASDQVSSLTPPDTFPKLPANYAVDPRNLNLPILNPDDRYSKGYRNGTNVVQVDLTGTCGTARWYLTPDSRIRYANDNFKPGRPNLNVLPANELLITDNGQHSATLASGSGYDQKADGSTGGKLLTKISQQVANARNLQGQDLNIKLNDLENHVQHLVIDSDVALPTNATGLFSGFHQLSDFEGANLDTSQATNLSYLFNNDWRLGDLSSLSDWSLPRATNLSHLFSNGTGHTNQITNVTPLLNWQRNSNHFKNLSGAFANDQNLKDLNGLKNWFRGSDQISDLSQTFAGDSQLSDLSPLTNWNVLPVNNLSQTFANDQQLSDWSNLYRNWEFKVSPNDQGMLNGTKYAQDAEHHLSGTPYSDSFVQAGDQVGNPDQYFWDSSAAPAQFNQKWHFINGPVNRVQLQIEFYSDHWTDDADSDDLDGGNWRWEPAGKLSGISISGQPGNEISDVENYLKFNFSRLLPVGYRFEPQTKVILVFDNEQRSSSTISSGHGLKCVEYDVDHNQFKMLNGVNRDAFTHGLQVDPGRPLMLLMTAKPKLRANQQINYHRSSAADSAASESVVSQRSVSSASGIQQDSKATVEPSLVPNSATTSVSSTSRSPQNKSENRSSENYQSAAASLVNLIQQNWASEINAMFSSAAVAYNNESTNLRADLQQFSRQLAEIKAQSHRPVQATVSQSQISSIPKVSLNFDRVPKIRLAAADAKSSNHLTIKHSRGKWLRLPHKIRIYAYHRLIGSFKRGYRIRAARIIRRHGRNYLKLKHGGYGLIKVH